MQEPKQFIIAKLENNYMKQRVDYKCFEFSNFDSEISSLIDGEDFKNGTEVKDGKLYIYGANFYNKYTGDYMGTNTVEVTFKFTDKFIDIYEYEYIDDFINACEELFNKETEVYEMEVQNG